MTFIIEETKSSYEQSSKHFKTVNRSRWTHLSCKAIGSRSTATCQGGNRWTWSSSWFIKPLVSYLLGEVVRPGSSQQDRCFPLEPAVNDLTHVLLRGLINVGCVRCYRAASVGHMFLLMLQFTYIFRSSVQWGRWKEIKPTRFWELFFSPSGGGTRHLLGDKQSSVPCVMNSRLLSVELLEWWVERRQQKASAVPALDTQQRVQLTSGPSALYLTAPWDRTQPQAFSSVTEIQLKWIFKTPFHLIISFKVVSGGL